MPRARAPTRSWTRSGGSSPTTRRPSSPRPPSSNGRSHGCGSRRSSGPWACLPRPGDDARMGGITTHVLDTSVGRPAAGIPVRLEVMNRDGWTEVGSGSTDADGRVADLLPAERVEATTYRLGFDTAAYFASR